MVAVESFSIMLHIGEYVLHKNRVLGKGAMGSVFAGYDAHTGRSVAIKQYPTERSAKDGHEKMIRFQHENIVSTLGIILLADPRENYVVMERCDGSLYGLLELPVFGNGLTDEEMKRFLQGLSQGVKYLAELGIVHRDIKPGNVLKTTRCMGSRLISVYKLGDLDSCKETYRPLNSAAAAVVVEDDDNCLGQFTSLVGTEEYLAPQIYERAFQGGSMCVFDSEKTSMWSMGVTVYQAACGELPFLASGGKRSNRSEMNMIIHERPKRCISGKHVKDKGVVYDRRLPEVVNLSKEYKAPVESMIADLLDAEGKNDKLSHFEKNVRKLCDARRVYLTNANSGVMYGTLHATNKSVNEVMDSFMDFKGPCDGRVDLFLEGRPMRERFEDPRVKLGTVVEERGEEMHVHMIDGSKPGAVLDDARILRPRELLDVWTFQEPETTHAGLRARVFKMTAYMKTMEKRIDRKVLEQKQHVLAVKRFTDRVVTIMNVLNHSLKDRLALVDVWKRTKKPVANDATPPPPPPPQPRSLDGSFSFVVLPEGDSDDENPPPITQGYLLAQYEERKREAEEFNQFVLKKIYQLEKEVAQCSAPCINCKRHFALAAERMGDGVHRIMDMQKSETDVSLSHAIFSFTESLYQEVVCAHDTECLDHRNVIRRFLCNQMDELILRAKQIDALEANVLAIEQSIEIATRPKKEEKK